MSKNKQDKDGGQCNFNGQDPYALRRKDSEGETDSDNTIDVRDVFLSFRVRFNFRRCDVVDKFLLDYNIYFLPIVSIVFWISLFFAKILFQ